MKGMASKLLQSKYYQIFINAFDGIGKDKIHKLSAALSYTTIFSLAPMLVLVILVGGLLSETEAIEGRVFTELSVILGESSAQFIQNLILQISFEKSYTNLATWISSIVLIVIATGLFAEIQDSLNMIWGVRPKDKKGFIKMLISRMISFVSIIVFGVFLAIMLLLNTVFSALSSSLVELFPDFPFNLVSIINNIFLFITMYLFVAMLFKLLPDVNIMWRDVWGGALVTTSLFILTKWLITLYISHSTTVSLYGAAGSVVVLMLWIYCTAFLFYFGALIVRSVSDYKGRTIRTTQLVEIGEKRRLQLLEEENKILKEDINRLNAVIDQNQL